MIQFCTTVSPRIRRGQTATITSRNGQSHGGCHSSLRTDLFGIQVLSWEYLVQKPCLSSPSGCSLKHLAVPWIGTQNLIYWILKPSRPVLIITLWKIVWLQLFEMTGLKIGWHRLQTAHALPFEATMLCSICAMRPERRIRRRKGLHWLQKKLLGSWSRNGDCILKPSIWTLWATAKSLPLSETKALARCENAAKWWDVIRLLTGRGGQRSWKGCTSSGSPMRRNIALSFQWGTLCLMFGVFLKSLPQLAPTNDQKRNV